LKKGRAIALCLSGPLSLWERARVREIKPSVFPEKPLRTRLANTTSKSKLPLKPPHPALSQRERGKIT
jgi:hypothetical protein